MKYSAISAVPLAVLAAYQANAQVTVYTGIPSRTATADPAEATVDYAGLVSLTLDSKPRFDLKSRCATIRSRSNRIGTDENAIVHSSARLRPLDPRTPRPTRNARHLVRPDRTCHRRRLDRGRPSIEYPAKGEFLGIQYRIECGAFYQ
jgi:hypothetical protein